MGNDRISILLAEDMPSIRIAIQDYLEDSGYDVITASTADAVLEKGASVDVLVVDVRLPTREMEGIDAVSKLVKDNLVNPRVPIIFISVLEKEDAGCQRKLRLSNLDNRYVWLQKPFEFELLERTILQELERRSHD